MFTVCPKCALTLVVTAADLRVAQGYVRCGRCSSVFNALAQLSDGRAAAAAAAAPPNPSAEQPEEAPAAPQTPLTPKSPPAAPAAQSPKEAQPAPSQPPAPAGAPSQRRPAGVVEDDPISEDALEFNPATTDASSVFVTPPPNPEWTAATGSFKALVAANQESTAPDSAQQPDQAVDVELDAALLSDIVETRAPPAPPAAPAPRDSGAARAPRPATAAPPPAAAAIPQRAAPAPRPRRTAHVRPAAGAVAEPVHGASTTEEVAQTEAAGGVALPDAPETAFMPAAARVALAWTIGAAVLALMLVLQMIDHQRDALATDTRFGTALTALYGSLGVHLVPRWDLRAYDVRQLGAEVEPGNVGAITVRASIRNVGGKPQPLPLLRVTLQDRFGNRLASREVPPRDYLPRSVLPPALLSVDQRIDAQLAFVDPGTSAVGFELDACLPARGGGVACANDTSAR